MSRNFLTTITNFVNHLERIFSFNGAPPPALCYFIQQHNGFFGNTEPRSSSAKDLFHDAMLWAVPKHRRSVEKRLNRKFGYPNYVWKPIKEKKNVGSCDHCGYDYAIGVLCPHCYNKVRQETQLTQGKIQDQLGLHPIEKEVVVLYEGEAKDQEGNNSRRIVEMRKPRPVWFTKNLLQKSAQHSSNKVKPTNLG